LLHAAAVARRDLAGFVAQWGLDRPTKTRALIATEQPPRSQIRIPQNLSSTTNLSLRRFQEDLLPGFSLAPTQLRLSIEVRPRQ
jgi:hypothetical protein